MQGRNTAAVDATEQPCCKVMMRPFTEHHSLHHIQVLCDKQKMSRSRRRSIYIHLIALIKQLLLMTPFVP